jgi:anti-anti-sigma regulatory factor
VFAITLEREYGTTILKCHGRIAGDEESSLLCAAVRLHGQTVILDLSHATTIDRSGIGALVSLQAAGIFLTLRNPNAQVLTALRSRHLESIFEICESAPTLFPELECHAEDYSTVTDLAKFLG